MKDKIIKLLVQSDLLGNTPCMYFENDKRFRTALGGSFSILWYISILFSLLFFGQELWKKLKPITNSSSIFDDNPSKVDYFKDFEFFFGLSDVTDGNKCFIDEKIYTVKATLTVFEEGASSLNKKPISMVPCTKDSFYEKDLFNKYSIDGFWCVAKNQNISISGIYGSPGFRMIEINLDKCINSTEVICKPPEVIEKYISSSYMSLFSIQNFVTTNDYEKPLKKGIYNHFYPVSSKSFTDASLILRRVEIRSDVGLLNDRNEVIEGFTQNNFQTQIILNSFSRFTTLSFQLNNIKEIYFRSYMKLQDLFALIGGFINFIKISLQIIFSKYYENDYFSNLIKRFFQLSDSKLFDKFPIDQDKDLSKMNLNNYIDRKPIILNKSSLNDDPLLISEKLFGSAICKLIYTSKKRRLTHFELMRDSLKRKLDITSILRTEFDFAKMRYLTMTKDQNLLFNLLDKFNVFAQNEYNNFISNPNYIDINNEKIEPKCDLGKKIKTLIITQTERSKSFLINN